MKFPIGTQSFETLRNMGYAYVDKTDLMYKLIDEGRIYFLSRPRRFGKSLLISTLKAYFEGKKELFAGLAIEKLETEWVKHPVLHFDFNGQNFTEEGALMDTLNEQLGVYEKIYGSDPLFKTLGGRFKYLLESACQQTGRQAVVLIDEYDKPMLDAFDTDLENKNREILRGFYSTLKGADDSLRFVLLTGVTKFSQVSVFSGLNQLKDISMNPAFDAICGITEEELFTVFAEPIRDMAEEQDMTEEEVKQELKRQYDGYHFSKKMLDVYNPFSLLNALDTKDFGDYWFATGTPSYLVKLLQHNQENLNDMVGRYYESDMFANYRKDVELPLPMIYQSGYLTIKGYRPQDKSYLLGLPNQEVEKGFLKYIASDFFHTPGETNASRDFFNLLYIGDVPGFITSLTAFLASIPYDSHESLKNDKAMEKHFQYTFYLISRLMGTYSQLYVEKESSYGRADCIIEMKDYVYIFEFKLDGTADEALQQIEEKGYATPYLTDKRKLCKLGIVFSSETRTVSEWKEA